jgi:hypothetical protein
VQVASRPQDATTGSANGASVPNAAVPGGSSPTTPDGSTSTAPRYW